MALAAGTCASLRTRVRSPDACSCAVRAKHRAPAPAAAAQAPPAFLLEWFKQYVDMFLRETAGGGHWASADNVTLLAGRHGGNQVVEIEARVKGAENTQSKAGGISAAGFAMVKRMLDSNPVRIRPPL